MISKPGVYWTSAGHDAVAAGGGVRPRLPAPSLQQFPQVLSGLHCTVQNHTLRSRGRGQPSETESEEDWASGYEGGPDTGRSHPHFYLDDDELILPIQPHSLMPTSHRHRSPQVIFTNKFWPHAKDL